MQRALSCRNKTERAGQFAQRIRSLQAAESEDCTVIPQIFRILTGDALEIAKKHGIRLEHTDYVQIHPTTLYSKKPGRRFLISESVRGEGAVLLDKEGNRFVNELLPRDVVTKAIREQMEKDGTDHVWLSMENIGTESILSHFPNIYRRCKEEGYDCDERADSGCSGSALFYGRHLGGQR